MSDPSDTTPRRKAPDPAAAPSGSPASPLTVAPMQASGPPCRYLRSQGAFHLGPAAYDETTRFWCVRCLDVCGPDGIAAHAAWCQPDRPCYHAPPDAV